MAEDVLEERLVAGEGEWAWVGEAVLLLRLQEELAESWVVEVGRPHHEAPGAGPHAHRHVARRHVRGSGGAGCRAVAPAAEHLAEADYVPDLAALPHSHYYGFCLKFQLFFF